MRRKKLRAAMHSALEAQQRCEQLIVEQAQRHEESSKRIAALEEDIRKLKRTIGEVRNKKRKTAPGVLPPHSKNGDKHTEQAAKH
jgi:hypothetical protein